MKRLLALFLLATLCVALFTFSTVAAAEEESFLEIDRDGVYLYADTFDAPPLFVIPRTYYVKIIKSNLRDNHLLVEYNGVRGVIKGAEVSGKILTDVDNPYYTATTISAYADTYLYESPAIASKTDLGAYGKNLVYLGKAQGEQHNFGTSTWFAVSYADRVYFIHSAMTENLNLLEASFSPVHPNSVKAASTSATTTGSSQSSKASADADDSFDVVRLILILDMIVPIVVILFLLFRPKRSRSYAKRSNDRERTPREEEEYDDY